MPGLHAHSGAEAILEQGLLFIILWDKDGLHRDQSFKAARGRDTSGPHAGGTGASQPGSHYNAKSERGRSGREISGQHAGGLGDLSASSQTIVLRQ